MKTLPEPKKTYDDIIQELKKIKQKGYIKTKRRGPTGVGMTLESLLGIQENNIPGPNGHQTELKSTRKASKAPITILTIQPLPEGITTKLCEKFGKSTNGTKRLNTTINAMRQNKVYGEPGFKLSIHRSKITLEHTKYDNMPIPYWDKKTLQKNFERKYSRHLIYVHAESKGHGEEEKFHYTEAWHVYGFKFSKFMELLKEGHIKVEIRMGMQDSGKPHDHGTGFRLPKNKFELFATIKEIPL